MIKVIDEKLLPDILSFGKKTVKVNKIAYHEKMDSSLIKSNLNLGTVMVPCKTDEGNPFFMPKEEVFRLGSLYRCIIDTGILLDETFDGIDYTVESHPQFVTRKGLLVLSPVKFNDAGINKLGVSIVNISSIDIEITKYMPFAVLVTREKNLIDFTFTYGQES